MHVVICNERLLFRFGLDRALLIIGKGLMERGHQVTFISHNLDAGVLGQFATQVVQVPRLEGDYLELDERTRRWVETSWDALFGRTGAPDVVLCGGWPFFSSIQAFAERGVRSVFLDCGAVPMEGYAGGALAAQLKVRELRKHHLPHAGAIASISDFIRTSQSESDAPGVLTRTVLLGADHMYSQLWTVDQVPAAASARRGSPLEVVQALRREGKRVVLNLGRWEPGSYKGSDALFPLAQRVAAQHPDVVFAVLAEPGSLEAPAAVAGRVHAIGFPDDRELVEVMRACEVGVTLSRWEGFNLPLAEMQLEQRPVLALALAAHPEVVADPWFLCADMGVLGDKLEALLRGEGPSAAARAASHQRYRVKFRWARAIDELERLLLEPEVAPLAPVVVDVTNACRDPANTGVMRVTRRLGAELQQLLDAVFVVWDATRETYVLPTRSEAELLGAYHGPVLAAARLSPDGERRTLDDLVATLEDRPVVLLLTETVMESYGRHARAYAKERGLKAAAIFYDAIPVLRPDLVHDAQIRDNHAAYMRGLAECDLVLPISEFSAGSLRDFWGAEGLKGGEVRATLLPGEFPGVARVTAAGEPPAGPLEVLCVATLEPRKNHELLLRAFARASEQHPQLDWRLTLVGNTYAGGSAIRHRVEEAARKDPRIQWLGVIDDGALHRQYAKASFTVYPSLLEGFGLPIVESLWHGKPCICHHEGVMAELASAGGCLTTDANDVARLADALARLATDGALRRRLEDEAVACPVRDWSEYGRRVAVAISRPSPHRARLPGRTPRWTSRVYPGAVLETWQMHDSERMALTGLLAAHRPQCSIEVGSYHGGSLSVLARMSPRVFSIDIDPTVPQRLSHLSEVSFLVGPSQVILPVLLGELDRAGMPVEFVLIDGDHSGEGVRRDVECVLDYVPRKPLFVLMHDSFNPDCRRGILAARWSRSPYVHAVDVDFVPGRTIEHGGGGDGEMWGGLAMAYLDPTPRTGALHIQQTSIRTFERALADLNARKSLQCAS